MVLRKVNFLNIINDVKRFSISSFIEISMMMIWKMTSEKPFVALTKMDWDTFLFQVAFCHHLVFKRLVILDLTDILTGLGDKV